MGSCSGSDVEAGAKTKQRTRAAVGDKQAGDAGASAFGFRFLGARPRRAA